MKIIFLSMMRCVCPAVTATALLCLAGTANAAVTVSVGDTNFFYGAQSAFQPFDPAVTPTVAERSVLGVRNLSQTFRLASEVTLDDLSVMFVRGGSGAEGRLQIFNVANTTASSIQADYDAAVLNGFLLDFTFLMPGGLDPTDNFHRALVFDFSGEHSVTLPATEGTAGYALLFTVPNGTDNIFTWRQAQGPSGQGNAGSAYTGGNFYADVFGQQDNGRRDGLFAINIIPEPSSLALLGLGALAMLFRLRRR
jgi:hypothetical protein